MKDLAWSNMLSIGIDEFDSDHRKLVSLFNILKHSVTGEHAPVYIATVLDELINFTAWHFSHEERLMLKYSYKEYAKHKAEHRTLIKSAKELQLKILRAGCHVEDEDIEFLERWLTEHILNADMRMGSYLVMKVNSHLAMHM